MRSEAEEPDAPIANDPTQEKPHGVMESSEREGPDETSPHFSPLRRGRLAGGALLGGVALVALVASLALFSAAPAAGPSDLEGPQDVPATATSAEGASRQLDNEADPSGAAPSVDDPAAESSDGASTMPPAEEEVAENVSDREQESEEGPASPSSKSSPSSSSPAPSTPKQSSPATTTVPPSEAADSNDVTQAPQGVVVSITVDSSAASELGFPASMASGSLELSEGSTAYDALAATGLPLEGSSSYVSAINGLAEKMLGAGSGWTYTVNGTMPMTAASNYRLNDGDDLRWIYVR